MVFRRLRLSASQSKIVRVVAAAKDLAAGVTLAPQDLILLDWPADIPLASSFSKTEAVVGRPLIYSMGSKEPILERDLAVAGSGIGLSGKIPPGMRATAVRSNDIVGVAGFLFPGSHVDVLATYGQQGGSSAITQTVLQDVEVLSAGQAIEPDPQGKAKTLLLSPENSQKLLLVSAQGTIQFVLRNGLDQKKVEINPTRMDQLFGAAKPPEPPAVTTKSSPKPAEIPQPAAIPKPPETYTLEVIQGTQRSSQKF